MENMKGGDVRENSDEGGFALSVATFEPEQPSTVGWTYRTPAR